MSIPRTINRLLSFINNSRKYESELIQAQKVMKNIGLKWSSCAVNGPDFFNERFVISYFLSTPILQTPTLQLTAISHDNLILSNLLSKITNSNITSILSVCQENQVDCFRLITSNKFSPSIELKTDVKHFTTNEITSLNLLNLKRLEKLHLIIKSIDHCEEIIEKLIKCPRVHTLHLQSNYSLTYNEKCEITSLLSQVNFFKLFPKLEQVAINGLGIPKSINKVITLSLSNCLGYVNTSDFKNLQVINVHDSTDSSYRVMIDSTVDEFNLTYESGNKLSNVYLFIEKPEVTTITCCDNDKNNSYIFCVE